MKIGIVADNASWRGVGVITNMQIRLLLEKGIKIMLVAPQKELDALTNITSSNLEKIPIPNISVSFSQIIYARRLFNQLDKHLRDVDLIYIPNMYYWAIEYANTRHIPSIITITMPWPTCFYQSLFYKHNPCTGCAWSKANPSFKDYVKLYQCIVDKDGVMKSFAKFPISLVKREVVEWYLSKASRIIAISQTVKRWLLNRYPKLSERIRVIYLGALFPPLPYVPPSNSNKLRLFYFSAPDEEKGIFNLLKALAIAIKHDKDITLKIMGADSKVEEMVQRLGLQDSVVLMPWYPSNEVFSILPEVIKDVDVVVVPCLNEDAWAGVTTQAMALGRPVLVSSIGGPREQVVERLNGYYCDCNNIEAFAKKILELKSLSKDELIKVGIKAREHYLSNYDPNIIINQLISVFREVTND